MNTNTRPVRTAQASTAPATEPAPHLAELVRLRRERAALQARITELQAERAVAVQRGAQDAVVVEKATTLRARLVAALADRFRGFPGRSEGEVEQLQAESLKAAAAAAASGPAAEALQAVLGTIDREVAELQGRLDRDVARQLIDAERRALAREAAARSSAAWPRVCSALDQLAAALAEQCGHQRIANELAGHAVDMGGAGAAHASVAVSFGRLGVTGPDGGYGVELEALIRARMHAFREAGPALLDAAVRAEG